MKPTDKQVIEIPSLGVVPDQMPGYIVRRERFGPPIKSMQREIIPTPKIKKPDEVIVLVMAAGINYNNVWAALGTPVDVISTRQKLGEKEDFHVGGSDASGVVYAVGSAVKNVKVGDEVVIHCGQWDPNDPWIKNGGDPMLAPSQKIWGYETNWGSFAQFTRVQAHQCLPKPKALSWEDAASYMLVAGTAYRMLHSWSGNTIKKGDVVLIWGGAGGLGCIAIQLTNLAGGTAVAVVSTEEAKEFCLKLGAKGVINRKEYNHWGKLPDLNDTAAYSKWASEAKRFGSEIWKIVGEKKNPNIVFEHPGQDTIPTSEYVCATGGMIVICAGTTGYLAGIDLRHHWMRQKRFQGSHFANTEQCARVNELVDQGLLNPCNSHCFDFDDIPLCHQLMLENKHPKGNNSALVTAPARGLKNFEETVVALNGIYKKSA